MSLLPRHPLHRHRANSLGTLGSSGAALLAIDRSSRDLPVTLRHNLASRPTEMNPLKGAFGENIVRRLLDRAASGSVHWIEPLRRGGGQGLDLLGLRYDALGRLKAVQVWEVKFGSSRLGRTLDGQQLGDAWTSRRLRETLDALRERAARTSGTEGQRLREQIMGLDRALEGKVPIERSVARVEICGAGFKITEEGAGVTGQKNVLVEGAFAQLPREAQRLVRQSFEDVFRGDGCSRQEARRLAQEACRDPSFFRGMARDRRWTARAGLDKTSMRAALGAAALAAGLRAVLDLWTSGRIDWRGVATSGLLGGAAGFAGSYAGVQVGSLLTGTSLGQALSARLLSVAAGRVIGVVGVGKEAPNNNTMARPL
jgi:hypothetical protein